MEVIDSRRVGADGEIRIPDPEPVEIHGNVAGFVPAFDRVLIKRLPPPPEGAILRPDVAIEQAERGYVIAVGESKKPTPPVGVIASFSKFVEEKNFDDAGSDKYALAWNVDIRGWHNA